MLLPRTILFTTVGLLLQVASAEVVVPYPNRNTTWIVHAHHNVTWRTAGAQQDPSPTSSVTASSTSSTSLGVSITATAGNATSTLMSSATGSSSAAAVNGTVTVTVFATANFTSSSASSVLESGTNNGEPSGTSGATSSISSVVTSGSSLMANTTSTAAATDASTTSSAVNSAPASSASNSTMSTSGPTCTCTNQTNIRRTDSDLSVEKIRLYTGNHNSTELLIWAGKVDLAAGRVEIQVPNVVNGSDYSIGIITSDGQEVAVSDQFTIVSG